MDSVKAIFVLIIAGCSHLCAAEGAWSFFKEFTESTRPTNLLVRFTVENAFSVNGALKGFAFKIVNGEDKTVMLDKPPVRNVQFIVGDENFVAVRSGLPMEMGFQRSALFSARGMSSNKVWTLIPSGQIQYKSAPPDITQAVEDSFYAFQEIRAVLNLGIAKNGPISWSGTKFQGKLLDLGKAQQPANPAAFVGKMMLSNGMPAFVTYEESNSPISTVVSYLYSTRFEVPFPSEIKVEKIQKVNGTNQPAAVSIYRISEFRQTIAKEELALFDTHYYLQKGNAFAATATPEMKKSASNTLVAVTGEPVIGEVIASNSVTEYLVSDGTPVAVKRKGSWQKLAPPPKQSHPRNRAYLTFFMLASLVVVPLVIVFIYKRSSS